MVVQRVLVLVRAFGHLPQSFSLRFARVLDWATRPFHFVNYLGSCLAARVYNRTRMEAKMDHVMDVRLCGFGSIEVEGRAYEHDIVIDRGVVRKRAEALEGLPRQVRTHSAFGRRGAAVGRTPVDHRHRGPRRVPIMPEVVAEAARRNIDLVAVPTDQACRLIAGLKPREVRAVLHVTC